MTRTEQIASNRSSNQSYQRVFNSKAHIYLKNAVKSDMAAYFCKIYLQTLVFLSFLSLISRNLATLGADGGMLFPPCLC